MFVSTFYPLVSTANNFCKQMDPFQAWQNGQPDQDSNYLTLWWYSLNNFLEKVDFEKKISSWRKNMENYQVGKSVNSKLSLENLLVKGNSFYTWNYRVTTYLLN